MPRSAEWVMADSLARRINSEADAMDKKASDAKLASEQQTLMAEARSMRRAARIVEEFTRASA